jgi:GTP cyclohydrolase subunit MoaA
VVLIDRYGRPLLKLRIVVNSECNFNCFFCHFEGQGRHVPTLTPDDIGFVADAAMKIGIMDFKLTGGEPLLRRDIVEIVRVLSLRRPKDLSLTTNGFLLGELAYRLREAGLMRLNVSLHSLKPERYAYITGTSPSVFHRVMDGLLKAKDAGFSAIKLNMVVTKVNVDEVDDLIDFAAKHGFSLQLIELMPVGYGEVGFEDNYVDLNTVVRHLAERGRFLGNRVDLHNRPIFNVNGVKVEVVKNYMNPNFCAGCTTIKANKRWVA